MSGNKPNGVKDVQSYNKYVELIKINGWNADDFETALDCSRPHLSEKLGNLQTLVNVLMANQVLTKAEKNLIDAAPTENGRNEKFVDILCTKPIMPCLPLLFVTMDSYTMSDKRKIIQDQLPTKGPQAANASTSGEENKIPDGNGKQGNAGNAKGDANLSQLTVEDKHLNKISICIADDVSMSEWDMIMADILVKQNASLEHIKRNVPELKNRVLETLKAWEKSRNKNDRKFSSLISYFEEQIRLKETMEEKWETEWSKM